VPQVLGDRSRPDLIRHLLTKPAACGLFCARNIAPLPRGPWSLPNVPRAVGRGRWTVDRGHISAAFSVRLPDGFCCGPIDQAPVPPPRGPRPVGRVAFVMTPRPAPRPVGRGWGPVGPVRRLRLPRRGSLAVGRAPRHAARGGTAASRCMFLTNSTVKKRYGVPRGTFSVEKTGKPEKGR
jgi:hypothetical protein